MSDRPFWSRFLRAGPKALDSVASAPDPSGLEPFIIFAQALARATSQEQVQTAGMQFLPSLLGASDWWVLLRSDVTWTPIDGSPPLIASSARAEQAMRVAGTGSADESGPNLAVPLVASDTLLGVLGAALEVGWNPAAREKLAAAAALLGPALHNLVLLQAMADHCATDPLTGCLTRMRAKPAIEAELRRARRSQRALSLVLLNLDHLKTVNERYGEACGDAVLAAVGRRLHDVLRGSDLKCRWDGDAFLIVLPETPLHGAHRVAETLRREIGERPMPWSTEGLTVTASFGITQVAPGEVALGALLQRLTAAMRRAKDEGRHCARIAG